MITLSNLTGRRAADADNAGSPKTAPAPYRQDSELQRGLNFKITSKGIVKSICMMIWTKFCA